VSYREQVFKLTRANEFLKSENRRLEVEVANLIRKLKEKEDAPCRP